MQVGDKAPEVLGINEKGKEIRLSDYKGKKIYLLAWGEEKAQKVKECVEGPVTDTIPASYLQTHNNAHVAIDLSAAANLTRIQRPWLVTSCEWNDKLIRSAIVWLCQLTGKPILKLTNKDYNENGLSELLALFGSAYNVNIKIFNDLQHTITCLLYTSPSPRDA